MADTSNLSKFLSDVAEAIRTKKETIDTIPAKDFDTEILSIETGINTSDATATSDNIENGYTAYVNGEKISGTIATSLDTIITAGSDATITDTGEALNVDRGYGEKIILKSEQQLRSTIPYATIASMGGITSDKIIKGQSVFGVEGTATGGGTVTTEGVKLFKNKSEMSTSSNPEDGDLALIYANEQESEIEPNKAFRWGKLKSSVITLDEPIWEEVYYEISISEDVIMNVSFGSYGFDLSVYNMSSGQSHGMHMGTNGGYTFVNGTEYDDYGNIIEEPVTVIDFGYDVVIPDTYENVSAVIDLLSKFVVSVDRQFSGIYKYGTENRLEYININNKPYSIISNFVNNWDSIDIENSGYFLVPTRIEDDVIKDFITYSTSSYVAIIEIETPDGKVLGTTTTSILKKEWIDGQSTTSKNITLNTEEVIGTWINEYGDERTVYKCVDEIQSCYPNIANINTRSDILDHYDKLYILGEDGYITESEQDSVIKSNHTKTGWHTINTQLTLSSHTQLLPGIIGFGNGVVTGTDAVYDELDPAKINSQYIHLPNVRNTTYGIDNGKYLVSTINTAKFKKSKLVPLSKSSENGIATLLINESAVKYTHNAEVFSSDGSKYFDGSNNVRNASDGSILKTYDIHSSSYWARKNKTSSIFYYLQTTTLDVYKVDLDDYENPVKIGSFPATKYTGYTSNSVMVVANSYLHMFRISGDNTSSSVEQNVHSLCSLFIPETEQFLTIREHEYYGKCNSYSASYCHDKQYVIFSYNLPSSNGAYVVVDKSTNNIIKSYGPLSSYRLSAAYLMKYDLDTDTMYYIYGSGSSSSNIKVYKWLLTDNTRTTIPVTLNGNDTTGYLLQYYNSNFIGVLKYSNYRIGYLITDMEITEESLNFVGIRTALPDDSSISIKHGSVSIANAIDTITRIDDASSKIVTCEGTMVGEFICATYAENEISPEIIGINGNLSTSKYDTSVSLTVLEVPR